MLPLVMPWRLRKASSVLTSTSKIALPIPRTSYLASVILLDPTSKFAVPAIAGSPKIRLQSRRGLTNWRSRPITAAPAGASNGSVPLNHDPLLSHGIHGNAGLAPARIRAGLHDCRLARHRAGRRRLPSGVPDDQC